MKKTLFAVISLIFMAGALTTSTLVARQDVPFDTHVWLTNPAGDPVDPDWLGYCLAQGYHAAFQATRTGTATHLGNLINTERGCLDFSAFPVIQSRNIELLFIAANGDELTGMAEADFDFTQDPPRVIEGFFEFTGGTGRFANASGGGEVFDLDEAPGLVLRMVGTISYDASNRGNR